MKISVVLMCSALLIGSIVAKDAGKKKTAGSEKSGKGKRESPSGSYLPPSNAYLPPTNSYLPPSGSGASSGVAGHGHVSGLSSTYGVPAVGGFGSGGFGGGSHGGAPVVETYIIQTGGSGLHGGGHGGAGQLGGFSSGSFGGGSFGGGGFGAGKLYSGGRGYGGFGTKFSSGRFGGGGSGLSFGGFSGGSRTFSKLHTSAIPSVAYGQQSQSFGVPSFGGGHGFSGSVGGGHGGFSGGVGAGHGGSGGYTVAIASQDSGAALGGGHSFGGSFGSGGLLLGGKSHGGLGGLGLGGGAVSIPSGSYGVPLAPPISAYSPSFAIGEFNGASGAGGASSHGYRQGFQSGGHSFIESKPVAISPGSGLHTTYRTASHSAGGHSQAPFRPSVFLGATHESTVPSSQYGAPVVEEYETASHGHDTGYDSGSGNVGHVPTNAYLPPSQPDRTYLPPSPSYGVPAASGPNYSTLDFSSGGASHGHHH